MILKKIEDLDYDKNLHKISYSGASAILFFLLILICQGQQYSLSLSSEERLHMNAIEKGFKYK